MKASEKVPHHLVAADAASRRGYALWILRLFFDTHRMARTVVIDGVCSREATAAQGITAGSGFATEELCCLMLDVMDEIQTEQPKTATSLYVDEITIEAEGDRRDVAGMLKDATRILIDGVTSA